MNWFRICPGDLDIMGVVGSGSNHQILEEAGIEKADLPDCSGPGRMG